MTVLASAAGLAPLPGMEPMSIWVFRCLRCEHRWAPRVVAHSPRVCPRCKSPYWNVPRRRRWAEPGEVSP